MIESWSYFSSNIIQITGDLTAKYRAGQLITITQSGNQKFFVILSIALASGNTRLIISGGGVYTLTNEVITAHGMNPTIPSGLPFAFDLTTRFTEALHSATSKSTPTDTDELSLFDGVFKKLTWASLKAALGSAFAPISNGVTNGDAHDHSGGDGAAVPWESLSGIRTDTKNDAGGLNSTRSGFFQTSAPSPAENWPPGASNWWHLLDCRHTNGENNHAMQLAASFFDSKSKLYFRVTNNNPAAPWVLLEPRGFWINFPAAATRVDDYHFTVQDAGNANYYNVRFGPGTIIRWTNAGVDKFAVIFYTSYANNICDIYCYGDPFAVGFLDIKYCIHLAPRIKLPPIVGTIAVGDDLSGTYEFVQWNCYKFFVEVWVGTVGTANATTGHVNDDGAAINGDFSLASGVGYVLATCSNPLTPIVANSKLSIDITGVSSSPPLDLYAYVWIMPEAWRYMT